MMTVIFRADKLEKNSSLYDTTIKFGTQVHYTIKTRDFLICDRGKLSSW